MACKSVPKASAERLGSVPERPRCPPGVPGESPRASGDARKGTLERLGARQGDQNRRQVASESGKIEFSLCCAFAKHRRSNCLSFFVDFCCFCKVCEPLKVLRLPAKTEVRPFTLRVESLARCNLEKPLKSIPKSTQNRQKSRFGVANAGDGPPGWPMPVGRTPVLPKPVRQMPAWPMPVWPMPVMDLQDGHNRTTGLRRTPKPNPVIILLILILIPVISAWGGRSGGRA